jgi:hypothetical protein
MLVCSLVFFPELISCSFASMGPHNHNRLRYTCRHHCCYDAEVSYQLYVLWMALGVTYGQVCFYDSLWDLPVAVSSYDIRWYCAIFYARVSEPT